MRKLLNRSAILALCYLILVLPSIVQGQNISITIGDEQIDPIWSTITPIVSNDIGYGEYVGELGIFGDIVNAWLVFDSPDPNQIFFRVDGYSIEDVVFVDFDCDGDLAFTSEVDRSILFETNDDFGDGIESGGIDGYINYTNAYIEESDDEEDLYSLELAQGEFVVVTDDDGNELVQIEAILDLSDDKKFSGDMSTCFGNRDAGNWAIAYRYDSDDEQTPITTQQVRTAVTMGNQGIMLTNDNQLIYLILLVLIPMTFSLLILRRKNQRLDL